MLCTLMLTKLITVAPEAPRRRLEDLSAAFRTVLLQKPKENAVKQEIERITEGSRAVLKVSVLLSRMLATSGSETGGLGVRSGTGGGAEDPGIAAWNAYLSWVRQEHGALLKAVESELKDKER